MQKKNLFFFIIERKYLRPLDAFIELDILLELINQDLENLDSNPEERKQLPAVLSTPEAMELWQKLQQAGYVDEYYQPTGSRPEAAVLADEMASRLGIEDKWKAFETLWNRRGMYRDYYTAINQRKSLTFRDKVRACLNR